MFGGDKNTPMDEGSLIVGLALMFFCIRLYDKRRKREGFYLMVRTKVKQRNWKPVVFLIASSVFT